MKLYVARDANGELWLYDHEPLKDEDIFKSNLDLEESRSSELPSWLFPEVTFENSPKEVELKLVEK